MIKFNPIKNKFPQGALKNDDNFYFEVFIKDDFYFNDFKIIIKNEYTGELISKSLEFKEKANDNYSTYHVTFESFNTGLYFYNFEFNSDIFIVFIKKYKINPK